MSNTDSFSDRLSAARMKHLNEQQNVSKHFLRTNLAPGRLALGATIVAGGASTLAFTLQSFAFAHSVSLIVIERAAFKQVISWMLVFGAAIELRNVTVHYTGRTHPALSNISLRIDAGQKVAITGPSGAGKSSLLKVIAGFTEVTQGEVLFNQLEATGSLGVRASWLGQRPYLFSGTLAENIALGRPGASRSEIEAAAARACVTEFAAALPDGLDTHIGERGLGLSGGEAQRVALARAFLKDASLLLLDEPTAHLDAETEAVLMSTIANLVRDKTVVLATHSLVLRALCDHVLELDEGTLRSSRAVQREEVFYA